MATGEPTRLALEVRFDTQPIEGRLYDDGEREGVQPREFSGWLGLMAAIEAARSAAPADGRENQ
jgi:hypothetical protein